ncbi:MAG: caspase, EACC1-associated type [Pseudonocardiaceae bacterium]
MELVQPCPVPRHLLGLAVPDTLVLDGDFGFLEAEIDPRDESAGVEDLELGHGVQAVPYEDHPGDRLGPRFGAVVGEGEDTTGVQVVADPADPKEMGTALAEAAEQATRMLLVCFVGHGLLGPGGELYLATRSTDTRPGRLAHTATAYAAVRNSLLDTRAWTTVVLLDCCFSGRAVRVLGTPPDAATELAEIRGAYVLTSAGGTELALAPEGEAHTAFTDEVIRLLWEGDPTGPAQVTLDHVYRHLCRALPARGCPKPRRLAADRAGELVIAVNTAYRPPDAPGEHEIEADGVVTLGPPDVCPYPGMAAFSAAEAQWFFGRERVVQELANRLIDHLVGGGPLVVVAPSGAGKSSVLRAGLLPALARGVLPVAGSRNWPRMLLTPTDHPVRELTTKVASLSCCADPDALVSAIIAEPCAFADALRGMLRNRAGGDNGTGARAIVVVDQLEEAFTQCSDERERGIFLDALRAACTPAGDGGEPPALMVLGLRADFYSRCADYPWLRLALQNSQVFLGPLDTDQLHASIEKPAHALGLALQPGLVELLLHDLGVAGHSNGGAATHAPGMLPLLAHALRATWHNRTLRTMPMTVAGYQATGGIQHAIATTAERAYGQLDDTGQHIARQLLLRMVQVGEGTEDTRRRVDPDQLVRESTDPATAELVLDALARARLVTLDRTAAEITHEALLRAWPRLRGWIDADPAGLLIHQQLTDAAQAWDREGRHPAGLHQGPRLAAVRDWAETADPDLSPLTREFLSASTQHERDEQHTARRRTRRLRQLVVGLTVLVLLTATATGYALQTRDDAIQGRNAGISRQVAGEAVALRTINPDLAAQLSLAAFRLVDTAEARGALISTVADLDPARVSRATTNDAVRSAAFSPDGGLLAVGSHNRFAYLWEVTDSPNLGEPLARVEHLDQVRSVAFNPHKPILATASRDDKVKLWDITNPRNPTELSVLPHTHDVFGVAFSPDGQTVATASEDKTARLWDITNRGDPSELSVLAGHEHHVLSVAFSLDGKTLATSSVDGTFRLWDITNPTSPGKLAIRTRSTGIVYSVAFSPDGKTLATSQDTTARLWDITNLRDPNELSVLADHTGPVFGVAFSRDGKTLATISLDNTARLWNINDRLIPTSKAGPLVGHTNDVHSAAFSPDRHTLATTSHDQTVRLWETDIDRIAARICDIVRPAITRAEWGQYFPDLSYNPPCP